MKSFFLMLTFLSSTAFASQLPECRINELKDAKKCMEKTGRALPSYEEENETGASERKDLMKKVLKALGARKEAFNQLQAADFVGFSLEHGDEHSIYYFLMKKGQSAPVEFYSVNLVDLEGMLEERVSVAEMFLGTGFNGSDVAEDIQEAVANFGRSH
ncbi:MAG: hypothetical protein V4598_05205 [Bdellovibrionota bacterium]